jgi:hypothetical protein
MEVLSVFFTGIDEKKINDRSQGKTKNGESHIAAMICKTSDSVLLWNGLH